jgi:hypothetical protein
MQVEKVAEKLFNSEVPCRASRYNVNFINSEMVTGVLRNLLELLLPALVLVLFEPSTCDDMTMTVTNDCDWAARPAHAANTSKHNTPYIHPEKPRDLIKPPSCPSRCTPNYSPFTSKSQLWTKAGGCKSAMPPVVVT